MNFLLNLSTRTIHNADSTSKRCRIEQMHSGNKMIFPTYQEAKDYLPAGKKVAAPCSFCLGADYETQIAGRTK